MSDPKVAILMVRRDDAGRLFVVDGNGKERESSTPEELAAAVNAVLDDPDLPDTEQVANLEHAAERMAVQAAASFLPDVAKPLAEPLVRDLVNAVRKIYEMPSKRQKRGERVGRVPTHERDARRRASRIRSSRMRLGASVKRKGDAA